MNVLEMANGKKKELPECNGTNGVPGTDCEEADDVQLHKKGQGKQTTAQKNLPPCDGS
jgi:hypothetical protein